MLPTGVPRHKPIYLDNNASTRCDPRVVAAMLPWFSEHYGNPASKHHAFGRLADEAVEEARTQVAELLHARPREVVFTSGATESNTLALAGAFAMLRSRGNHIVTAATEHKSVLDTLRRLARDGANVTVLPVDATGLVHAAQVEAAITEQTVLVSLMVASNEIGTLHPVAEIGAVCKRRGVVFHTDAVQAVGKVPLDVEAMGIDLLSLSAHKMYGPKGVGALYVRRHSPTVRLQPLFEGGGQERGLRSGTLNVPGIVGLGLACRLCQEEMATEAVRVTALRERLRAGIMDSLEGVSLNGHPTLRLPGNLNLSIARVRGEALLMGLRDIIVSSGSACTSANPGPSYVLQALGVAEELALASLRFGPGRFTTEEEIDLTIADVVRVAQHLRSQSIDEELYRHAMAT